MNQPFRTLAIGASLALAALSSDVLAGRGGGRGGGAGGGMSRGGGGGGFGGGGGGMSHSPSFSSPRAPSGGQAAAGNRNKSNDPSSRTAAAGTASYRNQPDNAGAAAAGAANRNQSQLPNSGAAAGAGVANRNQPQYPNASAAAAGAGVANRNQPQYPNAGATAANRNQPTYSNAGAAAAGAAVANSNNQNASVAAGAAYANNNNPYRPGMVNGTWNSHDVATAGGGVAAWGSGSPAYGYGYSGYANPYAAGAVGVGAPAQSGAASPPDYSQPISTTGPPPDPPAADQGSSAFDQALAAFKAGDYPTAQNLTQQALGSTPNDLNLHEFLSLTLFAQGQYEPAAAPLYAVLSVGPGWDWTTLSGMYPDVQTYTVQRTALESYIAMNPRSAPARFLLAYDYLCEGHNANAVAQLQEVVTLQPDDKLAAQLLAHFQPPGTAPATPPPPPAPPADLTKLTGTWAARSVEGASIRLTIKDDAGFSWNAEFAGRLPLSITGTASVDHDLLTLAGADAQAGTFAGHVAWKDDNHFNFRASNAPPGDPGLDFGR